MDNERIFSINEISFDNLNLLSDTLTRGLEQRRCELAFIADEVLSGVKSLISYGMSIYEILTLLSEELDAFSFGESFSLFDKTEFVRLLLLKSRDTENPITEKDFLHESETQETFTYVRNSLSDEAYDVFSDNFEDPRVSYSDNFREACFALADGKVGYAILPLEEKGGMRIPGISSFISSLDLKIIDVTPVFGFEGTADMKYALLSRSFKIPKISEDTDRYLEIRINPNGDISLATLFSSAEKFGLSVYKTDTQSVYENEENVFYYSVVLKDGGDSFAEFLTFMTLFADGSYTPVGIYKNLE